MLNKNQIKFLKALAHHLNPVILMGAKGISENLDKEINLALDSHELIKIKLAAIDNETQQSWIEHIKTTQKAEFISQVGHIAIFYRANKKKENRILLPK